MPRRHLILINFAVIVDLPIRLLTDTEFLLGDDCAVTIDVLANQVIQEAAALTYENLQSACGSVVLVVLLQVLGQVLDALREQSDLAFGASRVAFTFAILCENLLFLFC